MTTSISAAHSAVYSIDAASPTVKVRAGHLKLGGTNPAGDSIAFNSHYMELNGAPVLPVMGEFHFSRYPAQYWEEEIRKMKAGGVRVVATYVFWIIHEEEKGVFDWAGDRDLRRFIQLCADNRLWAIVRIGPYCHGEIRNGGLPDWLYGEPCQVRSDNEGYLRYVSRLYREIGRQLDGLLFKDGGPVIGLQLENEYQSAASLWALTYPGQPTEWTIDYTDAGKLAPGHAVEHMRTLKALAREAGLDVPLYTATGWGGAAIIPNETIPVTSAYAYPAWSPPGMSPIFTFKDIHKNPDYPPASYRPEDYPSFCAEMGAGMMITYGRRPTVPPASGEALAVRAIGSGANGIGYYMFHGGSTPRGKHAYMSDEMGGCPKISYDFQAPIREFGQINQSYRCLKPLHFFLDTFGPALAPMMTVLPEGADAIDPADVSTLRFAARVQGNSGFLFLLNFQDYAQRQDMQDVQVKISLPSDTLAIPRDGGFTLKKDAAAVLPFNLAMGGVLLKYATAQPITRLQTGTGTHYFFYAIDGMEAELAFDASTLDRLDEGSGKMRQADGLVRVTASPGSGTPIEVTGKDGAAIYITVLTREQALKLWRVNLAGQERVVLSDATVLERGGALQIQSLGQPAVEFSIYPPIDLTASQGEAVEQDEGIFKRYRVNLPPKDIQLNVQRAGNDRMAIAFPADMLEGINDVFIEFDYVGDTAMGDIDGRLVCDDFYRGRPWQIGTKRFKPEILENGMNFHFKPLYKAATFLQDLPPEAIPDFSNGDVTEIRSVKALPEYEVIMSPRSP